MSYFVLSLVLLIIAAVIAKFAFNFLHGKEWFLAWLRGTAGLLLSLATLFFIFIAIDLYSYRQVIGEQNIATISFRQLGQQHYLATFSPVKGTAKDFEIFGDQWQLDSRIIKWHSFLNTIGMKTGFRLDRLGGRYISLADERSKQRSLHTIESSVTPIDFWQWLESADINGLVDARFGSSTYLPMVDGGQFQVNISSSGLIARPINSAAREAVNLWQ